MTQSWKDYREECLNKHAGGRHTRETLSLRQGIITAFEMMEEEFPPADVCKAAAEMREVIEANVLWFDAEDQTLGTFHDRMDLCCYSEWACRKVLGQDVGEFKGVPRLIITTTPKEKQ